METYDIHGVEIFSAGTWNGDTYDLKDLKGMVEAFEKHKTTVRPFLKLGHDEDQELIQKDGLPAAGWIDRLYIVGEKLLADFNSIPKKIHDLILSKAYRKVSSEIYWNVRIGEEYHKHMLGAVALLGADTPGVMNLNDILGMYTVVKGNEKKSYELNFAFGEKEQHMKTEQEIKLELDLKAKADEIEAIKRDYSKAQEDAKARDAELETLRAEKKESEKKALEAELAANQAKIALFTTDLINQKLASPAMKPHIEALLGEEKKEYTLGEKNLTKQEIVSEMLKLFKAASEVNFTENSSNSQGEKQNDDKETDKKIKAYAAEHKLSYGQATKIILSQSK